MTQEQSVLNLGAPSPNQLTPAMDCYRRGKLITDYKLQLPKQDALAQTNAPTNIADLLILTRNVQHLIVLRNGPSSQRQVYRTFDTLEEYPTSQSVSTLKMPKAVPSELTKPPNALTTKAKALHQTTFATDNSCKHRSSRKG